MSCLIQVSQISAECQIDIPLPGVRARRQSDDDDDDEDDDVDVPAIPGQILELAAALKGGPFDDDGT